MSLKYFVSQSYNLKYKGISPRPLDSNFGIHTQFRLIKTLYFIFFQQGSLQNTKRTAFSLKNFAIQS